MTWSQVAANRKKILAANLVTRPHQQILEMCDLSPVAVAYVGYALVAAVARSCSPKLHIVPAAINGPWSIVHESIARETVHDYAALLGLRAAHRTRRINDDDDDDKTSVSISVLGHTFISSICPQQVN